MLHAAFAPPLGPPPRWGARSPHRRCHALNGPPFPRPATHLSSAGLYYSYILPDLVVGSQPRTKEDVDHIAERVGAKTILNLQQAGREGRGGSLVYCARARHIDAPLPASTHQTLEACARAARAPPWLTPLAPAPCPQDKDMAYWGVDVSQLRARADASGVALLRCPARDFDPHSLRHMLPAACRVLEESLCQGQRVYVHCTAGLGRAPAVAIAWLYW